MNQQGTQPQHETGIEQTDRAKRQAPGYNELDRDTGASDGETNQQDPDWRPGDEPASTPVNSGMQGEGEPGRAQRDSTGGVEGDAGDE
jgi:hypothetical protein